MADVSTFWCGGVLSADAQIQYRQARLLTRDHTILNDMIDDGSITSKQSENAPSFMRGLTSHFMADPECDDLKVNIVSRQWLPGERLLLCSDGLDEVLSDAGIAALLVGDSVEDLLNACKASRPAGGTDDFSVIVLKCPSTQTDMAETIFSNSGKKIDAKQNMNKEDNQRGEAF